MDHVGEHGREDAALEQRLGNSTADDQSARPPRPPWPPAYPALRNHSMHRKARGLAGASGGAGRASPIRRPSRDGHSIRVWCRSGSAPRRNRRRTAPRSCCIRGASPVRSGALMEGHRDGRAAGHTSGMCLGTGNRNGAAGVTCRGDLRRGGQNREIASLQGTTCDDYR